MKDIQKIFETLNQNYPNAKTELEYVNDYTLLVAVILSAQSTDKGVNKATKNLFEKIKNPIDMLAIGEDGLKEYIKSIGLFNSKAKNIILMSKILVEEFSGLVPNNFNDLIKLPGVGRKTANVVMNCLYGALTIAVDTHVKRLSLRLGLTKNENPDKIEKDLLEIIPKEWHKTAHHLLILHGRYICQARSPKCDSCNISNFCYFFQSHTL